MVDLKCFHIKVFFLSVRNVTQLRKKCMEYTNIVHIQIDNDKINQFVLLKCYIENVKGVCL